MKYLVFMGLTMSWMLLTACSTTNDQAVPVVSLTGQGSAVSKHVPVVQQTARPGYYVVQKGDTLYGIALEHGLDYRELADWNHLTNINHIQVGQSLQVAAPGTVSSAVPSAGGQAQPSALQAVSVKQQIIPVVLDVTQPLAIKLPYSPANVTTLEKANQAAAFTPNTVPVSPLSAQSNTKMTNADMAPVVATPQTLGGGLDWVWPTDGPVISGFGDAGGNGKGIDIGGTRGQAVVAAAAGKVVYSASGLHDYGNLVIIKHNANYLTAYAHNQRVLVKEGQTVSKGQKIAEMGDSDANRVELHFEVRLMGKPVDPMGFLPKRGT
ncbi:MAG: peptidoglycan DD-metalloendopeptidase family protein [Betaproteobacteria bacterium]|nr:peptidoglycan DD-metalloendopeptidase family protein [Betaproteobacteria bacterium]